MPTAVWKLGGSLFDLPDLSRRLQALRAPLPLQHILLVPGGGAAADLVREWQAMHGLADDTVHELAIRAMEFNAHRLAAILTHSSLAEISRERIPVLSFGDAACPSIVEPFAHVFDLPRDWTVTSDSLAAWIAAVWSADELLLLKSRPLEPGVDAICAAERGWVDAYFPQIAGRVPRIRWCDLRADDAPVIQDWLIAGAPVSAR
jgi:aspartokinase-like uncharacterized kinase